MMKSKVNGVDGGTGKGGPFLVSSRSAWFGSTVTNALPLLLAPLLSFADETFAVLVNDVGETGALALIVIDGAAPVGSDAAVQVTARPMVLQVQPEPDALMAEWPGSSVSVTETLLAMSGPALLTVSV